MITAKIVAHSKCAITGKEIITWELEYQRFIHAEFMTHRLFSRNAASSRAIPVAAVIEQVRNNPAMPIHWGQNQAGMQAKEELSPALITSAKFLWKWAARFAANIAEKMVKVGLHKQAANRILEPFQMIKVVMTTTEDDNWFWLRNHTDAQPEIRRLAEIMLEAKEKSTPFVLQPGEWHVPYVHTYRNGLGGIQYCGEDQERGSVALTLDEALAISSSCCAQVSYRKLDDSLEKAQMVFKRLVESEPVHASPFEHQATPMKKTYRGCMDRPWFDPVNTEKLIYWEKGITHRDKDGNLWSGNLCGWIQHRQLIPNNVCKQYLPTGSKE